MPTLTRRIANAQLSDNRMSSLIATVLQAKWLPLNEQEALQNYEWDNGLLYYQGKAAIPRSPTLRREIIDEVNTRTGCQQETLRQLKELYHWDEIHQNVQETLGTHTLNNQSGKPDNRPNKRHKGDKEQ